MTIPQFFATLPADRQELLQGIHELIVQNDPTVKAEVGMMMGKQMLLYNAPGTFKYGLSSVKNYMSLHLMPIYAHPPLVAKYKAILTQATFQKGCVNFKSAEEMPLPQVKKLIQDCSQIDLQKIREDYLRSKKKK